jgi:quercetin 2,3-dioxygenase
MRTFEIQPSDDRLYYDLGWLESRRSFGIDDEGGTKGPIWGPLVVFNEDVVKPGTGFDDHPHRDMEILTYVLSGRLEHRDSQGHHGIVEAGGVQFMHAGTGVVHSEYNASRTDQLRFLQMWIVPGELGLAPSYGQVAFEDNERRNRLLPIASGRPAVDAPISLTQDAAFFATRLEHENHVRHTFDPHRLGYLFVADGELTAATLVDEDAVAAEADLAGGDAVRIGNTERLVLHGDGLALLWDLPPTLDRGKRRGAIWSAGITPSRPRR